MHCALSRVPGFPRCFKARIARRFFGARPAEKAASVHACARVSRAIMPADVRLYIFLQRGGATDFRRSRRAEFMRPGHQSSIPKHRLRVFLFFLFSLCIWIYSTCFILLSLYIICIYTRKINQCIKLVKKNNKNDKFWIFN